jgi:hypothetical protein
MSSTKKINIELSEDQKAFLDATRQAFANNPSYVVNVEDIYKLFGWESFKSATSVIRRHSKEFVGFSTRPHKTVPKKIVYELNLEGFKTLMRHAHSPAMRSKQAMDYFLGETSSSESEQDEEEEDDDSIYGEDGEEEDAFEETEAPVVKRRKIGEEVVSRTSLRNSGVITEETIAAVMDRLADEAHKVQADNPECKFPVGVSAKTAEALGWTNTYRRLLSLVTGSAILTKDRDYQVCVPENR